uniref:Vacuolar protein sorting protein n=2 Tax=Kalmanozyma brasiliensis (strain GHG001) TaxID=1365824 RepID=V5END3_KALBG
MDSCRASILTDSTEFSTSSTINRGYAARIDVNGKVKPLSSTPDRHACQTIAFLEGPSDSVDYKTYRPGDEIKGAVHLLRNDPERGYITGIKARIRGDLETSVFGVGDSSYYSMDNEHGIARRQMLFFSEQKTIATKADLEAGAFGLEQTGLVDHGRRNNLAVPFSFVLPLKLHASALDMLDSKLKKSFKRGKQYIDLPPSVDMETRYAPPKQSQRFGQVRDRLHGQKLRPMARIKYEIDIIVSRQRFGSILLPHKRGERIILAFAVEPYPPRTAGLAVPTLEPIRARRTTSRSDRAISNDRSAASDTVSINSSETPEEESVDDDSWASDLGGFRRTQEIFGALPFEAPPAFGPSSLARSVSARPGLPGTRRKSYINVKEGVDGRMKGWLTHSVESTLPGGGGSFEAILSVPAMAALYMETKIPFSLELRMPQHLVGSYVPDVQLGLVRSVMTYSRLGTLVIEKEDPDNLAGFSGPHSWSERIRIVNMDRQADTHLPPFYEQGQARQIYTGNFAIGRYEKMIKAGSSSPLKQKLIQEPELRLVVPSFSFKALRIEYRLRVKISLPEAGTSTTAAAGVNSVVMETPPVHVAANPDTVDFTRQDAAEQLDDDSLSTVDVLDEDEERLIEASASRMRRPVTPPSLAAHHSADDDEEDFSAQATPLARTPLRRSLDMTALTSLATPSAAESETLISSAASIISESSSSAMEVPSLDPIPDEADVDEEDELTEQLALGLIDREHAAAVVAARARGRAATITSIQPPTQALPSYSDSIGILG